MQLSRISTTCTIVSTTLLLFSRDKRKSIHKVYLCIMLISGPPGSYSNIMEQEQKMDRWYVAHPAGYFGRGDDLKQADTVR